MGCRHGFKPLQWIHCDATAAAGPLSSVWYICNYTALHPHAPEED